jgi:acyl-CoA reductase-like NAD-dependent aldehyde dehydrogenase
MMESTSTYQAVQAVAPGRLELVRKPISREQKTIDRFIGQLSFGGGAVNQVNVHLFVETMPFGGIGPSGMGHYYGKHGST